MSEQVQKSVNQREKSQRLISVVDYHDSRHGRFIGNVLVYICLIVGGRARCQAGLLEHIIDIDHVDI